MKSPALLLGLAGALGFLAMSKKSPAGTASAGAASATLQITPSPGTTTASRGSVFVGGLVDVIPPAGATTFAATTAGQALTPAPMLPAGLPAGSLSFVAGTPGAGAISASWHDAAGNLQTSTFQVTVVTQAM